MTGPRPRVRAVVVNYNGGDFVKRCIEALLCTEWPADRFEITVVDNASVDGSASKLEELFPTITLIRSGTNLGFAGGSNLGMGDVRAVDYIALVNSDAFVEPDWLTPLVDALQATPKAGAASPKLVFEPKFVEVRLETDGLTPNNGDTRLLGAMVNDVRGGTRHAWRAVRFPWGFYGEEMGGVTGHFRWSEASGVLHAPVDGPGVDTVDLLLSADRTKHVKVTCGSHSTGAEIGIDPRWVPVAVDGECFDVVNNAGSLLVDGGHGADRGFGERDVGQYDKAEEVFAWCGAAVLLDRAYLLDIGLFDPDYFLYYEDFDLSWRGRSRGWADLYVPEVTVRHLHTASTIEGSPLFNHFVQRNRLLTLVKNAPAGFAVQQCADFVAKAAQLAGGELVMPLLRGSHGHPVNLPSRLRSFGGLLKHMPSALRQRHAITARRTVSSTALLDWMGRR